MKNSHLLRGSKSPSPVSRLNRLRKTTFSTSGTVLCCMGTKRATIAAFIIRAAIILVWLGMIGVLLQRTYFDERGGYARAGGAASRLRPREEWMGIYWGEDKVGYTVSKIKRAGEGYQLDERAVMDLTVMGAAQRVDTEITSLVDNAFNLRSFSFTMHSNLFSFTAEGRVHGSRMQLKLKSNAGTTKRTEIELSETPCLAGALKPLVLAEGLAAGKRLRYSVFDPAAMASVPVDIEVEERERLEIRGKSIECYRLRSTFKGITLRSWIDGEGNTMREESPLGLLLVRESKADALTGNWRGSTRDFITASAIPVDNPIAEGAPAYLRVRLLNCALDGFDLVSERQVLQGNTLQITREELSNLPGCTIPVGGKEMQEFLGATPFIQSDDPALRRQAADIIADERDALGAAGLIKQWVYRSIEKKPTLSIPSALDVLKLKVGDCNEHTVLYVALCRAAGIPSRFCAGLVYSQGSFYYHAWAEVFAGRWVSVDPTLDQLPADATHIRLVEGALDRQLEIVRLIGVLKVEVIDYR
jgi:hypothetical protein